MAYNGYGLLKVRGADPEVFWIFFMDANLVKKFMTTSRNLTETEARAELEKMGLVEDQISSLVQRARANPV